MSYNPKLYQLPGKKTAFVFSDPASTNSCIALFNMNKEEKQEALLFSNSNFFPPSFSDIVQREIPDFSSLGIDCVFTGTSHPESSGGYEVEAIRQARRLSIYTISFIDHWINFRLRFEGLLTEELPDEIWVVDETAKKLAVEEGLPIEKLRVSANPYHYWLRHYWSANWKGKEYLEVLKIPQKGFHILFAPDPLSIRDGSLRTGFTEAEALRSVITVLKKQEPGWVLLVKPHPLQPVSVLLEVLEQEAPIPYYLVRSADNLELINAVDLVLGFHSNILLEAASMKKPVIRYFPGPISADLLRNSSIVEKSCSSEEELESKLVSYT